MKIVLYVNSFLPSIGGREIVVHYLAVALKALGHQVRVVGPAGFWSRRKLSFPYPLHRWPTLQGLFQEQLWFSQLFFDTSLFGCDIIHTHATYPTGYIASLLKKIKNIPLIITPHGDDIHVMPEIGRGLRLDPALRPKIYNALQKADLLTAISESIEDSMLDAGASKDKIRKIPNGIDIKRFEQPVTTDVKRWLNLEPESRLILTVGNYRPIKGHEILVKSMPCILEKEPDARLVIVGRKTESLLPLIHDLDLKDKVKLTGSISFPLPYVNGKKSSKSPSEPDWLAQIYRSSDIYVSSGIEEKAEGLSLAVLDAMAAKLPVVAADISGNRDIVKNGETGYLIPPGDPKQLANFVLKLLNENGSRRYIAEKAKETAKSYDWMEIARHYISAYKEAQDRCKVICN